MGAFRFEWDFEYIRHIIRISLPYGIGLFLSVVYFKIDIILLSLLEPASLRDTSIALYSLPMKIVEVLMTLGIFYLNSILPALSDYFHKNKKEEARKLLTTSFQILFALGMMFLTL
jgi:O-antigen/teichoic acid export membrane protein